MSYKANEFQETLIELWSFVFILIYCKFLFILVINQLDAQNFVLQ